MSDITLEGSVHPISGPVPPDIRARLTIALVRLWEQAVRHAERPERYVPYY